MFTAVVGDDAKALVGQVEKYTSVSKSVGGEHYEGRAPGSSL